MERIEDLDCNGLKIIQDSELYCFTSDSVLLANYAKAHSKYKVVELCAGSGVISILMSAKTAAREYHAVEIQRPMYDLLVKNIELNNLNDKINPYNISLQDAPSVLGVGRYDVVVCNPPYTKTPLNERSNEVVNIARNEKLMTLEDLIVSADKLLKYGGSLYFVHRAERLDEIMELLGKYKIQPKELSVIYPKFTSNGYLVMLKCVKGGKPGLKILPPVLN